MVSMGAWDLEIGIRDLLEAGLHFGHQTKRWNPKMKRFIFDKRNGIHVIDLAKSLVHLKETCRFVYDTVAAGRKVLFVGTKKQVKEVIEETAARCGQFYVSNRWLGGTLTNTTTLRRSVKRMKELDNLEKNGGFDELSKKEVARLRNELERLRRNLGGIAEMGEMPGVAVIVDINREAIAVAEANKLKLPVAAIVDTNCDPELVDYPIPGNDDAIRAVKLILGAIEDAIMKAAREYEKVAAELARRREAEKAAEAAAAPKAAAEAKPRPRRERKPAEPKPSAASAPEPAVASTPESAAEVAPEPDAAPVTAPDSSSQVVETVA